MAATPVTWHTVRRMFTGIDIATMRELGYPLDNYEFVYQNANVLLKRLEDRSMPPPPFGPWSSDKIGIFRAWIKAGLPYKGSVSKKVHDFIGLSQYLTGFYSLYEDPDLGVRYYDRLYERAGSNSDDEIPIKILDELIALWSAGPENETENQRRHRLKQFAKDIVNKKEMAEQPYVKVVKAIILLWYTGSFLKFGFPSGNNGIPGSNQWVDGLMWRAGQAHPPGYSTEAADNISEAYWINPPTHEGKYTGLGETATHLKEDQRP